jgi:hypothetical protein
LDIEQTATARRCVKLVRMTDPDSPGSQLIAALEAGGRFVDDGEFSVDIAAAAAKLGAFALANPDAWVLLLVEVASLLEATRVDFELEPNRTVVILAGVALTGAEIDGLTAWVDEDMHIDVTEAARRRVARRQLVIAHAVLLARGGVEIEIESRVAGETSRRLGPNQRESVEVETIHEATELRISVRFDVDSDARSERERAVLEAGCCCSTVPVHVNMVQVAKGWARVFGNPLLHTPEQLERAIQVPIELDGRSIGIAGFHLSETRGAFVSVLVNGVRIEDLAVPGSPGFRAVVEAELSRDLAGAKLIRGERLDALLEAVSLARVRAETELERDQKARALAAEARAAPDVGPPVQGTGLAYVYPLLTVGTLVLVAVLESC